jgi:chromosome segregation ATPase
MPAFIIVELSLASLGGALLVIGLVGVAAGYLFYSFRSQKPKVRADAIAELSRAFEGVKAQCEQLDQKVKNVVAEHERCQRKLNRISAFNLRLQAREVRYQKTINRMERKLGEEVTDFSDITDTPEDPDFG